MMNMWAFVDPSGRIVADPDWKGPMDAWSIGLDYPSKADIADAQLKGCRVTWINIRFFDGSRVDPNRAGEWCDACRDAVREADGGGAGNGSDGSETGKPEAGNENERGRASDRVAGKNPCDVGAKRDDRDLYEGLMN
jgi:hypothetical protein